MRNLIALVTAGHLLMACGGEQLEPEGHALSLQVRMKTNEGLMHFLSPAASVITHEHVDVVGKPYYAAAFEAGFSPGNDKPLFDEWGVVPEDFAVDFTTPKSFSSWAAYDVTFVVYVTTPMSPGDEPLAAKNGDLATFSINQDVVRPGEPAIIPGVIRFNVEEQDHAVRVENRTPSDMTDFDDVQAAFTNTLMIVP